jgi:predicted TPR repeat methyltransferase
VIETSVHWRDAQNALAKGDTALGIACLEKVVAADPANLEAYRALGRILRLAGRPDDAAAWYRRCLEIAPGDAIATMGLVALGRAPVPARLPNEVVLYVFDGNAESYEANMQSLGYSVPHTLLDILAAEVGAASGRLDVLELGCGSGLCGLLFRGFARRLVGVDLSPRMLALAAGKQAYDQLVEAELFEYLATAKETFDVVLAANVLIYFGELAPLVEGVARVLRPGGVFLFDVEKGDGPEPGFHVSGRYTHSRGLLEHILSPRGFTFARIQEAAMRTEQGAPVAALCCAARRCA